MKFFILLFFTVFAYANSGLDFYTNAVILEKSAMTKNAKVTFEVPFDIKQQDILVDANCSVMSFNFENHRKIEAPLETQRKSFENRLLALQDSYNVVKNSKFSENEIKNLEKISEILDKNLDEQRQISKQLDALNLTENSPVYKKDLVIQTSCNNAKVSLRYSLGAIKPQLRNNIKANSSKNSVEILQMVVISNLGESLKNATIRFFPYSINQNQRPSNFSSIYIQKEGLSKVLDAPATMAATSPAENTYPQPRPASSVSDQPIHSFNFWQIDGVNLKEKYENKIFINYQSLDANFSNYIDGYGTSKTYVVAKISPKLDIQAAHTNYYLNDRFISSSYISKSSKGSEADLFFGVNNLIEVVKNTSEIEVDESLFTGTDISKTVWEYGIKNSSDKVQNILFVERVPLSTQADVTVKVLGDIQETPDTQGKIEHKFSLKSNEEMVFKFGYAVLKQLK